MIRVMSIVLASSVCLVSLARAQEPQPQAQPEGQAQTVNALTDSPAPAASVPAASALAASTPAAGAPVAAPRTAVVVRDRSNIDMAKEYLIGPEDVLDVTVWKNCPDLCRTVPVRPDGKVSLPLVNDVQAAGLTPMDLRRQLTEHLSEFLPTPEVSVIVREVHNFKVAIVGAVKMPGDYELKSPATVLELLARAQGLTEFADRDRIVVLRQNGSTTTRIPFNYGKVAKGHDDQDNFYVRAGDIIVVP
jgi:polysaccharide export outer membrane protein